MLVVALAACNGGGAGAESVIASFTATPATLPGGGGET